MALQADTSSIHVIAPGLDIRADCGSFLWVEFDRAANADEHQILHFVSPSFCVLPIVTERPDPSSNLLQNTPPPTLLTTATFRGGLGARVMPQ